MTASAVRYRQLLWILPVVIVILAFYNILRSFEIRQLWTNKVTSTKHISATFDIPGLGNLMFQYASLIGIAAKSAKMPVLPANMRLCKVFKLPEMKWNVSRPGLQWGKVVELKHSSYDAKVDNLLFNHDIEVVGYLQSWKYFESYEEVLRKHFTFEDFVQQEANSFMQNVRTTVKKHNPSLVYIGIHIRRGDLLKAENIKYGYTVADKNYTEIAMKYFEGKYSKDSVIFIVASDDMPWCKANITSSKNVIFSEGHSDIVDLAILSMCNHTIMTVGTFGWWASWLAGGEVTYYKDYPKVNSRLSNSFSKNKEDYFPPKWIGLP